MILVEKGSILEVDPFDEDKMIYLSKVLQIHKH